MRKISIHSRKYDGRLRDQYQAFLYAEDDEQLVVYVPAGTPSYDHRKQAWSEASDGLLEIYSKTRWYTVWHVCEQINNVNQMYIHLSMPATATAQGIEWIDLDLDYRMHLDGRLERLDEDEYRIHTVSMGYPAELDAQVQAACIAIEALCDQQVAPFNHTEQVALYQQIKFLPS
jgi:protein associated with RNAse G/E